MNDKELNDKQKVAIILMQDIFAKLELTNLEVAEIMTECEDKQASFALFQFVTSRWLGDKKISDEVNKLRRN